jgi:iron complex transport system substrate-binding protein
VRRALAAGAALFLLLLPGAALLLPGAAAHAAERLRVASLVPFAEEAVEQIPEHAVVVAATRRRPGTPPRSGVVDLGSPHSPDLESLALARPDLVVGDRLLHEAHRDALARGGAEVLLVDGSSVESTFEGLVALGERAGAEEEMRALVRARRAALSRIALDAPLSVLALFAAPGGSLVVTERTWLGDLLSQLGFENVAAPYSGREQLPGYVELSDEVLPLLAPRLVVLVAHGAPGETERAFRERLAGSTAWRRVAESAGRSVHALDPELFRSNPGLAMTDAARSLVALAGGARGELPSVGAE